MTEVHPVLHRLFAALETQGVSWTLLRLPTVPEAPTGDVDVLVAERDVAALRVVARDIGFVPLPGWDTTPRLLLVRYDGESDHWLLLDVETAVTFRRPRDWRPAGVTDLVLARREVRDGVALPAAGDAFWMLLLHCVLDKDELDPRYHERLRALAAEAPRSPLGALLVGSTGAERALTEAAVAADWTRLAALGGRLAADLGRERTRVQRLRAWAAEPSRAVRRVSVRPHRRGVNLALLGPNGAGKTTVAVGLRGTFPFESRVIHMGLWKGVGDGGPALQVAEVLRRPLSLWGRYTRARYHQLAGRLVIFDRYVYEARLPSHPPFRLAKRLYHWVLANCVPPAEVGIVLDVPGALAFERKQENPPEELESERRFYAEMAGRVRGLRVVDASQGADAVRAAVSAELWQELSHRWGP